MCVAASSLCCERIDGRSTATRRGDVKGTPNNSRLQTKGRSPPPPPHGRSETSIVAEPPPTRPGLRPAAAAPRLICCPWRLLLCRYSDEAGGARTRTCAPSEDPEQAVFCNAKDLGHHGLQLRRRGALPGRPFATIGRYLNQACAVGPAVISEPWPLALRAGPASFFEQPLVGTATRGY